MFSARPEQLIMKESTQDLIKRKSAEFKKGKSLISMKDIGRKGKVYLKREAWTFLPQSNLPNKVFILERLRKEKFSGDLAYKNSWKKGDIEYRLGYFIVGKIGRAKGKWVWGQFCPMIPRRDFLKLIKKAKKEKTII